MSVAGIKVGRLIQKDAPVYKEHGQAVVVRFRFLFFLKKNGQYFWLLPLDADCYMFCGTLMISQ